METHRSAGNQFSDQIKKQPSRGDSAEGENPCRELSQNRSALFGRPQQLRQAIGTKHTIVMFGDAFATKIVPALRTARDGFAFVMPKTTLLSNRGGHHGIPGDGSGGGCLRSGADMNTKISP